LVYCYKIPNVIYFRYYSNIIAIKMIIPIADELRRIAKGEILSDSWSRKIYSVDASHYTITPLAVVNPIDKYDVEKICQHSFSKNIAITARGAGTGLLGQSLSNSILIDFTKYMNKIIEIGTDYVEVQPGIIKGILDKELRKRGKFLPPDPSSSNYCTIGGMIANNSSGAHCLGYGNTIDFLQKICVVYSDGSSGLLFSRNSANKLGGDNGDKMLNLLKLLSPYLHLIQKQYPKVAKNSCGYRLDAVINDQGFFSPQKIFAASEGTLGIVTSARMKILDIPLYRYLLVLGFEDLLSAVSVVPIILQFFPVALEMLDHTVIYYIENTRRLASNAGCILFVEFSDDKLAEVERKVNLCRDKLSGKCDIIESVTDEQSMIRIWGARTSALNHVMKLTFGSRKPVGLIEDTVVNVNLLHDYIQYLQQMYDHNKLEYVMYGHVGDGNLHTRPLIDIDSQSEMKLMERLANNVFNRVIRAGGTITGEHGDGLARVKYIESVYGSEIFSLFLQIKKLFDPKFIMNPGKKVIQYPN
jgi:FAD/FMN-containing dehydrogenase